TFVTVTDPHRPAALEHRITYFAATDAPGITPGQRAEARIEGTTPRGRALSPRDTLRCFGCHATPLVDRPVPFSGHAPVPALGPLSPNVPCERCHGPGRAHVTAARAGRTDLAMPFGFDRGTAASQLALCGQCHRHPARFPKDRIRPDDPALARFQP